MQELKDLSEIEAVKMGDEALSEVANIPGVFEAITQDGIGENVDRFDELVQLSDVIRLYGESNIYWSESFNEVRQGYKSFKQWLQEKLRTLIDRFQSVQVINSEVVETYIVFSEIHCPKINGCIAYHIQQTESVKDYFIELKIFGFGGGSGKSVKLGTGWQIPTKEECRQILKPIKVLIEHCRYNGQLFDRVSVIEIKGGYKTRVIDPLYDNCKIPIPDLTTDQNWESHPFESPYLDDPTKIECWISVGNQWNHSMAVDLGPLNAGLKVSITAVKATKFEYKLFGHQLYYGYRFPRTMGYYWTW